MIRRLLVPLLALWAVSIAYVPVASAETVFPPGLRIGLEPPGDFTVSTRQAGFEDTGRNAVITILDLPARAYDELARSAFANDQQGIANLKRESFPFESGIGLLITGTGNEGGGPVHKWFLLAAAVGGEAKDLTALVQVQVPEAALSVYSDAVIRKALASVTFRSTPVKEQLGLLPFQLKELAGFRVMQVLPAGGVILTDGPADDITGQPYMIVAVGPGAPSAPDERGRFANDLLATAPLANLRVQLSEAQRIGGAPGYEIRAQATGPRGDPVSLVQWVRFGGSGFLRIIGVSGKDASGKDTWDAMFPRFRAVRDGVEPR
ncbi:MAG: hypothetical protein Q8M24_18845 [Pseudolabrys sp.]|nr:hypothetical protein [Pseudolabrys sp.]MDP2297504.1 hypothetical protein [Pseudolabrys sp.]